MLNELINAICSAKIHIHSVNENKMKKLLCPCTCPLSGKVISEYVTDIREYFVWS